MSRDYESLAAELGVEDTPEWRENVEKVFDPDNILKLYLFAAIKALGQNNTLTFEIPDSLTLPEDGNIAFGYTHVGTWATITLLEGEALEAINNSGDREPSAEHSDVREVGVGEDTHSSDVPEPSAGGHGGGVPNSDS